MVRYSSSSLDCPFYKRAWSALIIAGLLLVAIGEYTNIDLLIEDYYFNSELNTFPWRDSWFASDFMHGYVKNIMINSGYLLYFFLLIDWIKPWQNLNNFVRLRLRFVAVASIIISLTIRTIKQFSVLHCPWSIDRYGGTAPFLRLLEHTPVGIEAGHCFPAAHATVGIWLAAICVFWLPHNSKVAVKIFVMGLSIGLAMGWVQQMRGAHFLFHTLWTVWLASLIILLMLQFTSALYNKDNKNGKSHAICTL